MRTPTSSKQEASRIDLQDQTCPACGMPAPAALVVLPSGRRALIEACAICGRQEVTPMDAEQAARLLEGRELHGQEVYG